MKLTTILCLILTFLAGLAAAFGKTAPLDLLQVHGAGRTSPPSDSENVFDLSMFGASGDGVTDDGPALQAALNAAADAAGGIIFVPAGRYAILTPVQKDFTGRASSVTILGVESSTPVPPLTAPGRVLAHGLDLVSEFAPRTGDLGIAIDIKGLQGFLIKDIAFIGTPDVTTDALITLSLNDISQATIRHCEFYGLSSLIEGGAIVQSVRSNLKIEQSVFLGSTCNSGVYSSVVQNIEWKGITIADAIFLDYGLRAELYGKLSVSAPFSWVNIGNAAAPESDSPRREVVLRNVFLDEGGFIGLSSLPYRYAPPSAPIDLLYITGLYMNVSNLGTTGHYLYGLERVLVEKSHYGWSHNTDSAINLLSVGNAILDQLECVDAANRIRADSTTEKLTVINSVYTNLDSNAQETKVITTATPEDDPVQYVRQQFLAQLGRDPDAAAHFYWSDRILQCGEVAQCVTDVRAALAAYLNTAPSANFSIAGQVMNETGAVLPGVIVTLGGSQSVATQTDADGGYFFGGLPTSGSYTVTPTRVNYNFEAPAQTITTPNGDQTADFTATLNRYTLNGHVLDATGQGLAGATVALSGSASATATTDAGGNYSFIVTAEGNYALTPSQTHYTFALTKQAFNNLSDNETADFEATLNRHTISGRLVNASGNAMADTVVSLSGSQSAGTTTDVSGDYSFADLPAGGEYYITPAKTHYTFFPASASFADLGANKTANFTGSLVSYAISGRVTNNGQDLSGVTVLLSGSQSGSATTDANGNYSFNVLAEGSYTVTPAKTNYLFSAASMTFNDLSANQVADFGATLQSVLEFNAASYSVTEGTRTITVTVERTGDTSSATEVTYSATDGSAQQRSDVIPVIGRLRFEPGETSKSFIIFITDDAHVEGDESLTLELGNVVDGTLGNNSTATLTIVDNDSGQPVSNPIDGAEFFVRQHYRDFLNREPDADGLAFWSSQITSCGTDAACIADRRMNVSAAFFLSIEFQQTGFLVHRLYRASFALPPEHLSEFLLDTRTIAQGVVVNAPGWEQLLEANKTTFIESFVARPQFTKAYPLDLTPAEFVNQLNSKAGGPLSPSEIAAAIEEFEGTATSKAIAARARVWRRIAESETFSRRELNSAFVLMQYFGYLQRNPDEAPDTNLDGYDFWLHKINDFNGDFRSAEMVKSFLVSAEYRARFGAP